MKTKILMYHGVEDKNNKVHNYDGKHISVELFEKQAKFLSKNYKVIPLRMFIGAVEKKMKLPKNSLIMTFDDGYMNNYENAFPILKKYNLPATIFLTTSYLKGELQWTDKIEFALEKTKEKVLEFENNIYSLENSFQKIDTVKKLKKYLKNINQEKRDKLVKDIISRLKVRLSIRLNPPLNKKQIKEISSGIDFGNHTVNHYVLTKLGKRKWKNEIRSAKNEIEKITGKEVVSFAYPDGAYNEELIKFVKKDHKCALTTIYGYNDWSTNFYKLRRIAVDNHDFLFFKSNLNLNMRKGVSALNKIKAYIK